MYCLLLVGRARQYPAPELIIVAAATAAAGQRQLQTPRFLPLLWRASQESGVVLHELDKIGCGTAYGKAREAPARTVAVVPT